MKIIGKVVGTDKGNCTVAVTRNSACSSCHDCKSKDGCHVQLILGNQKQSAQICALNKASAKTGDIVEVETSSKRTLSITFVVFFLPIVISLISYFVTNLVTSNASIPEMMMIVTFILSFAVFAIVLNKLIKNSVNVYYTVKILEERDS